MSEELIQRDLTATPDHMGPWEYYNIGATSLKALKAAGIIPNTDYAAYESKKPDALIVNKPIIIAAIEYKQPSQLKTKKQIEKAVQQEIGTAKALKAIIYIVTDGKKTFWINPLTGNRITLSNGDPLSTVFNQHSDECVKLISRIISSISKDNDALLEQTVVDPLPLAQQVWQDLWAVSGATPENCLYSFVEIFIFKYLSDLGVLSGLYSFGNLLAQYGGNTDNEVLEFYANTVRPKIKELFPGNPKDRTTIINGTIFVSKDDKAVDGYAAVFRKILERFEKFGTLEKIDYDFKSKLFETFLKESISKKNWGQFFTPLKVVRSIVDMADVHPGMSICDPACGVGKFLLEPILHDLNRFYKIENGELKPQITLSGFDKGFDRDEQKTIILAKANMLIYLSALIRENPGLTADFANLFNDTFLLQTNSILGTLAHPIKNKYDLILTNPPYVMSGSSNLKEEIAKQDALKQYYSVSAMGIEGLFMEWIVRALRPGGKAFVVVPDGIMNRGNDKRLRDFILEECVIDAVISLPINTFFTTNKKTYILAITKKVPAKRDGVETKDKQTSPVFTYLCSEIGETRDVYRFDIKQNDLAKAAGLFNMFKGAKSLFRTNDMRCKIVDIVSFYTGTHWSVDRWWTQEERVALGIEEEAKCVTPEGFVEMVDDIAVTLTQYEESIRELINNDYPGITIVYKPLSEILEPVKGKSKYTRKYGDRHKGQYPVFSASSSDPLTFIDSFDYEGDYLSWSTNGFAGTVRVLSGRFSINGDRGLLIPKNGLRDVIDIQYLRYVLEPAFRQLAKGRKGDKGEDEFTKLYPSMIGDISVPLPVNPDGGISIEAQHNMASRYDSIEKIKAEIKEKLSALLNQKIKI